MSDEERSALEQFITGVYYGTLWGADNLELLIKAKLKIEAMIEKKVEHLS